MASMVAAVNAVVLGAGVTLGLHGIGLARMPAIAAGIAMAAVAIAGFLVYQDRRYHK